MSAAGYCGSHMNMYMTSYIVLYRQRFVCGLARLSIGLLIAVLTMLSAKAQTADAIDTVRVDTDLVNVNVSVFGRDISKRAPTLAQKDFAIFENGVSQEISFFASAETPFDLVLLLDLSGSTANKVDLIRKSSKRFVDAARSGDRVAIVTFSSEVKVVSALTPDHEVLKEKIDNIERPGGGTNFWDALRFVLEQILSQSRPDHRRSAVVVMTDGIDNALPEVYGEGSQTSFDELIEVVRRSDLIVLPIYLDTEKEAVSNHLAPASAYISAKQQLAQLAAESGNLVYQARKLKDLDEVYSQVIRDLSTMYSIGYRPANPVRDGSWHNVTIQLIGHPELVARAKRGYYAK